MDSIKVFGIYQEEYEKLLEAFSIKMRITKEDALTYPRLQEGIEMEADPMPETPEQAYKLLTDYYAVKHFIAFKDMGLKKYHVWNKASLKTEIDRIEEFRSYAEHTLYNDAISDTHSFPVPEEYIYLKWINGFYEHASLHSLMGYNNSNEARVYGEYFLYYEWLKAELDSLVKKDPQVKGQTSISDNSDLEIQTVNSFDDLFKEEDRPKIYACVRLLQETDPPIINSNMEYIGRVKGEVIVWYKALVYSGLIINKKISDGNVLSLLAGKFRGFKINASALRDPHKKSRNKYEVEFRADLLLIKKGRA